MTATPGKTTPLPWRIEGPDDFGDYNVLPLSDALAVAAVVSNLRLGAEVEANANLIVAAVNALHAIAPGRELELAEALGDAFAILRNFILLGDDDFEDMADLHARASALIDKLGLNETESGE